MAELRLRNHIPLSGPATREPCDGSEPSLRVSLGFTPRWYHRRLGVDFSERWHADPDHRYETLLAMKRHLHAVFPSVPYFAPRMENGIEPACATISGLYGIMLVSMLYGIQPVYRPDGWPDARDGMHFSRAELEERLAGWRPIDLDADPAARELFGQMEHIARKWGRIHGYLNYQGVLNIAMKLRGSDIFMDLFDDPDFCRGLFAHIAGTIGALSKRVQARQRRSGFPVNLLSMSNCVMNMVSPEQYEDFVLPLDRGLSLEYERFGVHTCNWKADAYLDSLRKIEKMGYIDTGLMSDLPRIRRLFPDARRAVLYPPVELEAKQLPAIRRDLERVRDEYAPCDLVMADVEDTTPDGRVNEFLALAEELGASVR